MTALVISVECSEGPLSILGGTYKEADHEACPGGESAPGLIGGWTCACRCHETTENGPGVTP